MKTNPNEAQQIKTPAAEFRKFLQERFSAARRRNPRFTLRAFARQLSINHSTLSQILRRKRRLTSKQILKIAARLGLPAAPIPSQLPAQASPTKKSSPGATAAVPSRKELSLDEFQVISEWYHSAILELTKIRGFRTDTRWIAKQLDLSPEHVNIAIQRLLRLGFLEMKRREEWLDRSPGVVVPMEVLPEPAQKNIYKQAHELSHLLIEKSPMGAQLHGHAVLALGREQLPEILDLYERFQEKLSKLIEAHPQKDAVYQLIFSLCPLTRPNEEANKKENKEKHLE